MWSRGEEREQQHATGRATEAVSLDRQSTSTTPQRQRYFIDGPARLTSALQLISSAIGASAANAAVAASPAPPRTPPPPSPNHHPHGALVLTAVSRSRSEERLTPVSAAAVTVESEVEFGNEDSLEGALSSMPFGSLCPSPGPRTIVAADGEVSNGFVKDGQRLPYVFEASDSGNVPIRLSFATSKITIEFQCQERERGPLKSCPSAECAASASSASPR